MSNLERGAPPPEPVHEKASRSGNEALGGSARGLWDPRAINQYWLGAMSQAFDVWMRSNAFLKLMGQGLEMATALARGSDLPVVRTLAAEPESEAARFELADCPPSGPPSAPPAAAPADSMETSNAASPATPVRTDPASASKGKRKIQAKGNKSP